METQYKIQIINNEYPKLVEIFDGVTDKQIDDFMKRNNMSEYSIKVLDIK